MRHLSTILLMLVAVAAAGQTNRIYIEDFEIAPDSTVTVPVMLSNVDETRGIQFNVTMPPGLQIVDENLSEYAGNPELRMNLSASMSNDSTEAIMVYPSGRICFPPDVQAIVLLDFKASKAFKGGDLLVWKCRGSTIDNATIYINDDTTHVTVPQSSVISIPEDRFTVSEAYYDMTGLPITSPDTVPVAILVTTCNDGTRTARKVASRP